MGDIPPRTSSFRAEHRIAADNFAGQSLLDGPRRTVGSWGSHALPQVTHKRTASSALQSSSVGAPKPALSIVAADADRIASLQNAAPEEKDRPDLHDDTAVSVDTTQSPSVPKFSLPRPTPTSDRIFTFPESYGPKTTRTDATPERSLWTDEPGPKVTGPPRLPALSTRTAGSVRSGGGESDPNVTPGSVDSMDMETMLDDVLEDLKKLTSRKQTSRSSASLQSGRLGERDRVEVVPTEETWGDREPEFSSQRHSGGG
ncbi:hypothetical protein HDU93_009289 [Gonapodya sp. JEL0774]|nr:hypothetical protein HDU93_009289 [Gonapodya sp. JEL0774]